MSHFTMEIAAATIMKVECAQQGEPWITTQQGENQRLSKFAHRFCNYLSGAFVCSHVTAKSNC